MFSKAFRRLGAIASLLYLSGCATYGDGLNQTLQQVETGQYEQASQTLDKALEPEGDDKLLYHLELGTIQHLAGNYEASNAELEKAHEHADTMNTDSAGDYLAAAMANPRHTTYRGNDVERVYINYYKALNYLMLAQSAQSGDERSGYLESAQVEIRRLDNTLSSISFEEGNYEQVKEEEEKTFAKLMDLFSKFRGNWLDEDWLVFREDAYARYLAGVMYEKAGNFDDARISYQKAAETYESGYDEQYELGGDMIQRAWFDTIRMMRRGGGWEGEWQRFAEDKLSEGWRERLHNQDPEAAQLVVIQHLGMVPQRREMNLHLTANPDERALMLEPVLTGTEQEKRDQRSWFFLLYGDKGVMDMLDGFQDGGLYGVAETVSRKTVTLGPAWDVATELRIPQAIGSSGIRVTVPYYAPLRERAGVSRLAVNGEVVNEFRRAESMYQLFLQNQLLNAGSDLNSAMARATLKNVLAFEAGNAAGGGLGAFVGKLAASGTSAAETRNWLTLPYGIRVARVALEPGTHEVAINTAFGSGGATRNHHQVEIEPGEVRVLTERTIQGAGGNRGPGDKELKTAAASEK
jgi:hypothetical protein